MYAYLHFMISTRGKPFFATQDIYERFQGGQMTFQKVTMVVCKKKKNNHYHRERERSQSLVRLTAFWNKLLSLAA